MNKTSRNDVSLSMMCSSSANAAEDQSVTHRPCWHLTAAQKLLGRHSWCRLAIAGLATLSLFAHAETIEIGIGTQNTTTNTVTGGVVIKELKLLEKYLPKTGKYQGVDYKIDWQNFTSGPPVTNGMMANRIQIGMMGDYPLMVNGATGQETKNETQLVAVIAYNAFGSGNGIVVHLGDVARVQTGPEMRRGVAEHSPIKNLSLPKQEKRLPRFLTTDQIDALTPKAP